MPGPDTSAVPLAAAGGGEEPQDGQIGGGEERWENKQWGGGGKQDGVKIYGEECRAKERGRGKEDPIKSQTGSVEVEKEFRL